MRVIRREMFFLACMSSCPHPRPLSQKERADSTGIGRLVRALCLVAIVGSLGCSYSGPPEFRLNTEGREPASIGLTQRQTILKTLESLFGTPDVPRIPSRTGLPSEPLLIAAGPIRSDVSGRQGGLYRQHCVACHGISGDGAGPSAALQNPYPRDFRDGLFKYTSTSGGGKPLWGDLDRIVRRGIPGTSMPAFSQLPDEEIGALVDYVRYLSLRGQTELLLLQWVVDEDEFHVEPSRAVTEALLPTVALWREAPDHAVTPPSQPPTDTPELLAASIARGFELYTSKQAQCTQCHGPVGRGDGEQSELYDDWNRRKKGVTPQETRRLAARFRLPIQRLRPRNFYQGIFHGGSRPTDIYWRISTGIKGTPMPAGNPGPLEPEDIWHLVNYVLSRQ